MALVMVDIKHAFALQIAMDLKINVESNKSSKKIDNIVSKSSSGTVGGISGPK